MKALIALENIHTKFEQKSDENPRKSDFQLFQWRVDAGQCKQKYTNSSLDWRSKRPNITSLVLM